MKKILLFTFLLIITIALFAKGIKINNKAEKPCVEKTNKAELVYDPCDSDCSIYEICSKRNTPNSCNAIVARQEMNNAVSNETHNCYQHKTKNECGGENMCSNRCRQSNSENHNCGKTENESSCCSDKKGCSQSCEKHNSGDEDSHVGCRNHSQKSCDGCHSKN